ncbi:hypothetical protein CASFOL_004944 [Castilleja foliolosa]|uniref:Uncharacterized protein n=1 Tax=Castilleja foliolosa TaxID=1961234 RepID=A0ABD3ECB6_9LAMI
MKKRRAVRKSHENKSTNFTIRMAILTMLVAIFITYAIYTERTSKKADEPEILNVMSTRSEVESLLMRVTELNQAGKGTNVGQARAYYREYVKGNAIPDVERLLLTEIDY